MPKLPKLPKVKDVIHFIKLSPKADVIEFIEY